MSLIIDWLFPKRCFGCGKGGKYLCTLCEEKLSNGTLSRKDQFEGIISIYKYDGVMKKIVEKIKYEFVSDVIEEMAELMAKKLLLNYPNIVEYWQKEKFVLIAIPLYKYRKNWRGFNQSEILVEKLAIALNIKCENNILVRNIKTKNQATIKNRQIRQKNIKNVFAINLRKTIPKNIILVDDVVTSGATMTAALKTLKNSQVEFLWGLSLCGALK
jgi:ComF family protein